MKRLRVRHMPCKVRPNKKIYNRSALNTKKIVHEELSMHYPEQYFETTDKTINHTAE